ncbi:uncharacterized protein F4812DRAFT_411428, partial [Daldinia caldariorum]|uniref:uncharacterized protein n=1 Tax=Daldinia caldariorum TaxID=326644 RepID=UPI0020084EF9
MIGETRGRGGYFYLSVCLPVCFYSPVQSVFSLSLNKIEKRVIIIKYFFIISIIYVRYLYLSSYLHHTQTSIYLFSLYCRIHFPKMPTTSKLMLMFALGKLCPVFLSLGR